MWTKDMSYRFVNVGDAPAFDVVILGEARVDPFSGFPPSHVPKTHIGMVPPGKSIDVTAQVADNTWGDRPAEASKGSVGWPPIAPLLTLAWNTDRGWKPDRTEDEPLLPYGLPDDPRQCYRQMIMPMNQMPAKQSRVRRTRASARRDAAEEQFVQFERVLNVFLSSADALSRALEDWSANTPHGRALLGDDAEAQSRARAKLRQDLDGPTLAMFTSLAMLRDHAKALRAYCDEDARAEIQSTHDKARREHPFSHHAETVRNFLAHKALLDWVISYAYSTQQLEIEVDLQPILDWARTRDRNRTEAANVMFAEFIKDYGDSGWGPNVSFQEWIDQTLGGNKHAMLLTYRRAWEAVAQMP
ncbi:hypothetical protein C5E05_18955 [Pseudoclavibacter sp. AY1H1]|nr:hypothetical protein C5E05_18955 [Pseudoclavibacter sp. AY1H1]PPF74743.1 hypothetical protein C5B99_13390 [Pseudoclavibacter sp. Z016]